MTDTTATLPALAEIQKAYTGPGKFWIGDKKPNEARVYFGSMYVTVEVDGDWLRLSNGSARARERILVSGALSELNTGWYIRG